MGSGAYEVGSVRIQLIEWPLSTPVAGGRVRTSWTLEAMGSVAPGALALCLEAVRGGVEGRGLAVDGGVDGRVMTLVSTCAGEMAVTDRILAISAVWLAIDEQVGRIWKIDGRPRAFWVFAMRQRRRLVEALTPAGRRVWIAATLLRSEPLYAAIAGQPSRAAELGEGQIGSAANWDALQRWFAELVESIQVVGGHTRFRDVASELAMDDLGASLAQALSRAGRGIATDSVDEIAGASEYLFEALSMVDQLWGGDLARAEDIAWYEDAQELAHDGTGEGVVGRSSGLAREVARFAEVNGIAERYLDSVQR
jgi:hypothetical protein